MSQQFVLGIAFIEKEKKEQCKNLLKNCKVRGKKKYNDEIIFDALTMYMEYLKNK